MNGKLGSTAILMFHVKQFKNGSKNNDWNNNFYFVNVFIFKLYKMIKSEDEKIKPWYLFGSLLLSIIVGTAAFILFEK